MERVDLQQPELARDGRRFGIQRHFGAVDRFRVAAGACIGDGFDDRFGRALGRRDRRHRRRCRLPWFDDRRLRLRRHRIAQVPAIAGAGRRAALREEARIRAGAHRAARQRERARARRRAVGRLHDLDAVAGRLRARAADVRHLQRAGTARRATTDDQLVRRRAVAGERHVQCDRRVLADVVAGHCQRATDAAAGALHEPRVRQVAVDLEIADRAAREAHQRVRDRERAVVRHVARDAAVAAERRARRHRHRPATAQRCRRARAVADDHGARFDVGTARITARFVQRQRTAAELGQRTRARDALRQRRVETLRIDRAVVRRDRHRAARREIERAAELQRAAVEGQTS